MTERRHHCREREETSTREHPLTTVRWGPSRDHADPGLVAPPDSWQVRVASLPHAVWTRWRRRATELLDAASPGDGRPGVEAIGAAEHRAFLELAGGAAARQPDGPAGANPAPLTEERNASCRS